MLSSKPEIVRKLVPVFRQYGYEGATLSRISTATGLGRASLYHHFPGGKQDIAQAVLSYVEEWFTETIVAPLQHPNPPMTRLRAMCDSLNGFYNQGQDACLLSIFSLGEGRDLFQIQVQRVLQIWIDQLSQVLLDAGIRKEEAHQRAENAVMLIQGALVLARGLNCTRPFERILQQLPERLINHEIPYPFLSEGEEDPTLLA